jgi:hypothetical protein
LYHHINLTPERSGNAWWQETKNKLEKEWQLMIKESLYLKREVQKFHDIMTKEIPHRLSCRKQWEVGLKKLIGLQEELKIVAKKKHKIEVQLTGKANEDKQSSQLYGKLMLLLQELEVKRALPLLWDKILSHITLHDPNIVFHSKNIKDNLYFHFDLHDPVDLKIFLLALGDFFRWQDQCARQQNLFFGKNIYQEDCKAWWMLMKHLFPGFVRPHDFKSLSNFIQQDGVDLYASHYRLQEMKEHLLRSFGSIKVSAPLHQSATSMDLSNVFKHSMNYAATSRFFKRHAIWQRRVAPLKNELTDYTVASPLSMPVVKEGDRTSLFFGKE